MYIRKGSLLKKMSELTGLNKKGFTLLEILIAMGVFAIISLIIVTFFDSFMRGSTSNQVTSDVLQKARSSIDLMNEDIKLAGLDPEGSKAFNLITVNATTFTFDFDAPDASSKFDGTLNTNPVNAPERLTYRFLNGNLERVTNLNLITTPAPVPEIVVSGVNMANSRFEYLDESGAATAVLNDIRLIRIVLSISGAAGRGSAVTRNLTSTVRCPNLYYNSQRRLRS